MLAAAALLLQAAGTADAATALEVSAGESHTCALLAGGGVDCWGSGESGQLGDGGTTDSPQPVPVFGLANVVQIGAGGSHTCALVAGGTVDCWGQNTSGQLGDGTTTSSATPVVVSGLTNVDEISAGGEHTCALVAGGTVDCWGAGASGQLGDGGTGSSPTPVPVGGPAEFGAVRAGSEHTCAIRGEADKVDCWGADGGGQLGDGSTTNSPTPLEVPGAAGVGGLGAGVLYTCALIAFAEPKGGVECWGQLNFEGETTNPNPTPVALSGGATAIAVGGFHACALLAGAVECWGDDDAGQLGNGAAGPGLQPPVPVSGLADAVQLSAGGLHTCAVVAGGGVECWGANELGQLGDGSTAESAVPVPVALTEPPAAGGALAAPPVAAAAPRATAPEAGANAGPAPVFGKTVGLSPVSGSVGVRLPGHRRFAPLGAVASVPLETEVDTAHGRVELFAAAGPAGGIQSGRFDGGVFRVGQKLSSSPFVPGRIGLTVLTLTGPRPTCGGNPQAARASGGRRGGNHLWGDAHGNFQTGGRYASATVGGTKWLTAETCAGTRVTVARGIVSVTDKVRHRTVAVTAHHTYLARR